MEKNGKYGGFGRMSRLEFYVFSDEVGSQNI